MTNETNLEVKDLAVPSASIGELRQRMTQMGEMIALKREFLKNNLTEGIERDYAVIPGTQKLSLLKPGAEKLLEWNGYYATFFPTTEKEDWDVGLFAYTYRCEIKQKGSNVVVAVCEGDASSFESKYRFEWKYGNEIPASVNKDLLLQKTFGRGDSKTVKYQMIVANPADKRNTIRKMSQKRALLGATVLATASSDLFATDIEPEDEPGGATGNGHSPETTTKDYGDPISEAQGKRLYAIRKGHNIADGQFKDWLKAKYGLEDDRTIGRKIYDEICKACETGKLEMPATKPSADTAPRSGASSAQTASPGAKIGIAEIKELSALLGKLHKTEADLREWLPTFDAKYEGKGMNDVLAEDFEEIKRVFEVDMTGGSV